MNPVEIEALLEDQAREIGVTTHKLKAIYKRGVRECLSNGYESEPFVYGLTRVQRYIMASNTGNHRLTTDSDFLPSAITASGTSTAIELPAQTPSWPLIYSAVNDNGVFIDRLFPTESVEATIYDEDQQTLSILGEGWVCSICLKTNEYSMDFVG